MFAASCVPAVKLAADFARDALGAEPYAVTLNRLGWWTLAFLLLSLACTPVRILSGQGWPAQLRRMLGLFAFFYGSLHVVAWLVLDKQLDLEEMLDDLTKRRFVIVGMLAYLTMLPLAITSTTAWIRRLGAKRWDRLHRLVYATGVLGIVHFLWREKVPGPEQWTFAAVLVALFAIRFVPRRKRPEREGA